MKSILISTCLLISLFFYSCSGISNPVKVEDSPIYERGDCSFQGLDIYFADTCSYNFANQFLSGFDSVRITGTLMGSSFYVYSDSGDYNYWQGVFKNDSNIKYFLKVSTSSDSLMFKLGLLGINSVEEERKRFSQIKHLKIIKIEEDPKTMSVDVPENAVVEWQDIFEKYTFISKVYAVYLCTDI